MGKNFRLYIAIILLMAALLPFKTEARRPPDAQLVVQAEPGVANFLDFYENLHRQGEAPLNS